jgi:hypothetical protein
MYQVAADRLLDFTERNAQEIASQWWNNVKKNKKVPAYHSISEKEFMPLAVAFYKLLKQAYHSETPFEDMSAFARKYAEICYVREIPLHETIYALVMMRRQMWTFAEFHALFINALDIHQAADSINRTVLLADYASYTIIQLYQELAK